MALSPVAREESADPIEEGHFAGPSVAGVVEFDGDDGTKEDWTCGDPVTTHSVTNKMQLETTHDRRGGKGTGPRS
jgi:hypothetical protein